MQNFIATTVFSLGTKIMMLGVFLHKLFKTPAGIQLIHIENFQKSFLNSIHRETEAKKNRDNFFIVKGSEEIN